MTAPVPYEPIARVSTLRSRVRITWPLLREGGVSTVSRATAADPYLPLFFGEVDGAQINLLARPNMLELRGQLALKNHVLNCVA
jgi:hypothetical protein